MHLIIPSECRLRVFVTAKQEVFEFYDNAEHMLHRHTFSYGESIIQLLENWKETDEPLLQEAYEYLKKRAQVGEENMGEWNEILFRFQHVDNPFLYLLVMHLLALMLAAALICPAWGEDFRPLLENRPLTAGDSVSDWLAVASGRAGLQRPDYLRDLESYVTSMSIFCLVS